MVGGALASLKVACDEDDTHIVLDVDGLSDKQAALLAHRMRELPAEPTISIIGCGGLPQPKSTLH
ncbi:MAG: hypothetical protein WA840_04835 [Caulobacteraceae bacterium]